MSRNRFDSSQTDNDQEGITDIIRRMNSIVRVGTIAEVDAKRGRARVRIGGNMTTWIKWHANRAGDDQDWNPPSVKEQVTILSPSGRMENAVILPGLFNKTNDSPDNDVNHRHYKFKDGSHIYHDVEKKLRQTSIPAEGSVTTFLGDKTTHAIVDGEHIFKSGEKMIVSMHKDYIHMHHGDSGVKIEKDKVTITTPLLLMPPNTGTSGAKDTAPKDNTPANSAPQSGGTSTKSMPGNT